MSRTSGPRSSAHPRAGSRSRRACHCLRSRLRRARCRPSTRVRALPARPVGAESPSRPKKEAQQPSKASADGWLKNRPSCLSFLDNYCPYLGRTPRRARSAAAAPPRDGARTQRGRAVHHLQPAVQPARAARRHILQRRQPRAVGADAGAAAAAEGRLPRGRSAVLQGGDAELQGATRGHLGLLERHTPLRGRADDAGQAGIGAASARGAALLREVSKRRLRAAAGGGAGRGCTASRDSANANRHACGRSRRPGARRRPGPRRPATARDRRVEQLRHRRRGADGPCAGLAATARAEAARSHRQPVGEVGRPRTR
eukprot:scaffold2621_cov64-Phaeocystis_antarctica.AAC.4